MNRLKKEYEENLQWLELLNENKIIPGLERIEEVMKHLGNPQKKLRIIMIGGTNAKGTTCFRLNSTLTRAGIKVGCYTSPHLHSVRERIRLGNEIISIVEFNACISKIKGILKKLEIEPTYFEVLTASAYYYFYTKKIDYALMEIGLGGEWDAVNVGQAEIVILTTLGLDHEEYLGHTLEEIAETKAKIVDKESAVVTGWPITYHNLIPKCRSLIPAEEINDWVECTLKLMKLEYPIDLVQVPGRQEISGEFTLDTAHNTQAINFLMSKESDYQKILIGILKDKNLMRMVASLPKKCEILTCNLDTERGASSSELGEICKKLGYLCRQFTTVRDAMEYATGSKTLVTGSFYTVSAAREFLNLKGHDEL